METTETKRLAQAERIIEDVVKDDTNRTDLRLQLLEATAARLGGWDLEAFQHRFGITPLARVEALLDHAKDLVCSLDATGIPPALSLSALAREVLDDTSRRSKGAYHTDFRLALHLAHSVESKLSTGAKVVDPACGAGMLLAAVSFVASRDDPMLASDWLRNSVYAADLSPLALRGTLLSLAALTNDLDALETMWEKWRAQDSLLAPDEIWDSMAPEGFDIVLANPPWEKVKLTRHEFIKAQGSHRHYGSSYSISALNGYKQAKSRRARLAAQLSERYPSLATGDPDLYVAFTELLLRLTRIGGSGVFIVPGGLIRSKNTESLRRGLDHIFEGHLFHSNGESSTALCHRHSLQIPPGKLRQNRQRRAKGQPGRPSTCDC